MTTVNTHKIFIGDTLTPIKVKLKYLDDSTNTYLSLPLAGKTVFFRMEDEDGEDVVGPGTGTSNACTVTDAAEGECEYDFSDDDVDVRGTYYGYFMVFDGNERDTYPNEEKHLKVVIQ